MPKHLAPKEPSYHTAHMRNEKKFMKERNIFIAMVIAFAVLVTALPVGIACACQGLEPNAKNVKEIKYEKDEVIPVIYDKAATPTIVPATKEEVKTIEEVNTSSGMSQEENQPEEALWADDCSEEIYTADCQLLGYK